MPNPEKHIDHSKVEAVAEDAAHHASRFTPHAYRILWLWHAAVVAEYQKPLSVLADCDNFDVTLLVPRRWPERSGQMVHAEDPAVPNFRLVKARTLFTGFYYIYFFP